MAVFTGDGALNPDAEDVLYEIGNMGVGTAIVPIGNIREMEFRVGTPKVISLDHHFYETIACDPDQVILEVTTRTNNLFEGSIVFLLSQEFVQNTVEIMTGERYPKEQLLKDEDSISAIQEMTNYMTAGYVKVIGAFLSVPVYISIPVIGMDRVRNVIQGLIGEKPDSSKKIACVETSFTVVDKNGQRTNETGQVLILPDEKSIEEFIKIMK